MKKVMSLVMAGAMMLSLTSCKKKESTQETAKDSAQVAVNDVEYIKEKGKMIIGITEYEPMNYKEDGEWTGFDTEFAQAVGEKLGVNVEFKVIEWDNKIMELEAKGIDAVWNGMTLTDEVEKGMSCTNPYVVNAQVLVMNKDKVDNYKNIDELEDLVFVAESGSAGEKAIIDAGYECTAVGTQADALLEVSSNAADACVIDITMANAMTGKGTSYENLKAGLAFSEEFYGIGFRKGSDLTEEVNNIMDEMKEDGSLEKIADKYELTLAE